ncbi:MAG: hypothetical protein J6B04_00530 [Clostridia bacterium]|nr:hypothetical protein [Clostridia bacterium]
MRFKRAFSVLIDNFKITYKLLLYKIIVAAIAIGAIALSLYPVVSRLLESTQWTNLIEKIKEFIDQFIAGHMGELPEISSQIKDNLELFVKHVLTLSGNIILGVILVVVIYAIHNFLTGLGDYTAAVMVNDKMTLQSDSPFISTFIKNFASAVKYNSIYVPLSVLFDLLVIAICYLLFFIALNFIPLLLKLFLFVFVLILATSIKQSYTVGWLPSMIAGKLRCRDAIKYSFKVNRKLLTIFIFDFFLINVLIIALTVGFSIFTVGVAALIFIPASSLFIICYTFVYYFDYNDYKYFIDPETIVKPKKERKLTREEFFKGEQN